MEHDDRHLDSFSSSIIDYFNGVLIHENCVSSNFWKSNVKNDEHVEFSFPLLRSTCGENQSFNRIHSYCLTEEESEKIIEISKSWRLHLTNVSIKQHKLCVSLNKPHTFYTVIKSVLSRKSNYGKSLSQKQGIVVTSDDPKFLDLTEYRLSCVKTSAVNLLKLAGYRTMDIGESSLHFTTRKGNRTTTQIICGPVINSATRSKETQISFEEYRKLLLTDVQEASGDKNSDERLLANLVDTVIKTSFLQVSANQEVSLNLDPSTGPRQRGNKAGVFLQYTSSRLSSIRKKYQKLAATKIYPEIPPIESVDFSSLKEPEEWGLLCNFLLEYPSLIDRIAKDMTIGKSKVHLVCNFLSKLCSLFSAYYRKTRILLEPKAHLLQLIHARLLLAMSIEQVLENGLAILNICKVEEM